MIALTHHDLPYFHQESQFDFPINFNTFVSLLIIVIANSRPCHCNFGNNKLIIPSLAGPPPRPSHYEITLIICGRSGCWIHTASLLLTLSELEFVAKTCRRLCLLGFRKEHKNQRLSNTVEDLQYCKGYSVLF